MDTLVPPLDHEQPRHRLARLFNVFFFLAIFAGVISGVLAVMIGEPSFLLIGLAALIIFVGAVVSVQFGLLALVFIVYTRLSDIAVHNHNAPSVAKAFIALLLLSIFVRWAIFRESPSGWQYLSGLLALYGLIGFASILYAESTSQVIDALVNYAKDAIIAVIVVILLQSGQSFRRVVWVLLLVGIFLGTISVYQFLTGDFANDFGGFATAQVMQILGESRDYRLGGPIGDPNFFAQIMVVFVPIAFERFLHDTRATRRLIALLALSVSALTVMFTYSRGGFLAMGIAFMVFFFYYPPRPYHIPVIILAVVILFSFAPKNYFDRILSLDQFFSSADSMRTQDEALRSRATENLTAWNMVKANPLFGVGLSNYSIVFPDYSKELGITIAKHEVAAHNLYLEVVAETGVLGLTVFLFTVGISFRSILAARSAFLKAHLSDYAGMVTGFGAGFAGYMVAAMFIHGAFPRYFYLLIGIATSLQLAATNTIEVHHKSRRGRR